MYLFSLRGTGFTSNLTGKYQSWLTSTWSKRQFSFMICLIHMKSTEPDPQAGALTILLWISLWKMFIPTPIGLQICAAWIKEISALLVTARVGAQNEWKQVDVPQCCQGLTPLWRGCRSLNAAWNLKFIKFYNSEATLISYLWIGAPGPKGEKGMSGASEEGSQGPRGRAGRVTTTSACWSSPCDGHQLSDSNIIQLKDLCGGVGLTFPPQPCWQHPQWFLSAKLQKIPPGSFFPLVPIPRGWCILRSWDMSREFEFCCLFACKTRCSGDRSSKNSARGTEGLVSNLWGFGVLLHPDPCYLGSVGSLPLA